MNSAQFDYVLSAQCAYLIRKRRKSNLNFCELYCTSAYDDDDDNAVRLFHMNKKKCRLPSMLQKDEIYRDTRGYIEKAVNDRIEVFPVSSYLMSENFMRSLIVFPYFLYQELPEEKIICFPVLTVSDFPIPS